MTISNIKSNNNISNDFFSVVLEVFASFGKLLKAIVSPIFEAIGSCFNPKVQEEKEEEFKERSFQILTNADPLEEEMICIWIDNINNFDEKKLERFDLNHLGGFKKETIEILGRIAKDPDLQELKRSNPKEYYKQVLDRLMIEVIGENLKTKKYTPEQLEMLISNILKHNPEFHLSGHKSSPQVKKTASAVMGLIRQLPEERFGEYVAYQRAQRNFMNPSFGGLLPFFKAP